MPFQSMGLIIEKPISEVDKGVYDAFETLGLNVVPLGLDEAWRDDLDTYLIPGPFYPLGRVLPKIEQMAAHRQPNVIIWLTEQRPSSSRPGWFIRTAGDVIRTVNHRAETYRNGNLFAHNHRIMEYLSSGTRYRLASEIAWLNTHGYLKLLAVLTPSHQKFYNEIMKVPSEVIPFGVHESYGRDLHLERDIDVAFLGSLRDKRRSGMIIDFERAFQKMGARFVVHDGSPERGLVFGEERTRLLNRSKILLSIMRQPWDDPVFRMLLATPNGAMVVSEPVNDDRPYKPGEHLIATEIERIPETVKYYLDHEDERQIIVQNAHDILYNTMTNCKMAEKIVAAVHLDS